MAKTKLYGVPGSRAIRSLWAIEDIGIEYEHMPVNLMEKSQKTAFLAVNPNGRIPALQDGEVTLFESIAINLYLAKRYGGDLYPRDTADEAQTWQWSVWVMTEIEAAQMDIMAQKFFVSEEKRDPRVIEAAEKNLDRPLKVLDAALAQNQWLRGNAFSIADLNVAGVMLILKIVKFDYAAYPNIQFWLDACYARPSLKRAQRVGK